MIMKTMLISGATSGLGLEAVRQLAGAGHRVIGLGRNKAVLEQLRAEFPNLFNYYTVEFSDLDDVGRVAAQIKADYPVLDVLINNAAVNLMERRETKQGFEMHFGVNYVAQFYLTDLLLDPLKASAQGRIVNVGAIQMATKFLWDDYNLITRHWDNTTAVTNAKLAMFMMTRAFADQLADTRVTVNVLDPGLIRTPYHDKSSALVKLFVWLVGKPERKVVRDNHVWLATDPSLNRTTGRFFAARKEKKLKGDAADEAQYDRLLALSRQLTTSRS